jgi:uncharacterized protein YeaC (DUF1315 family)
MPKLNPAAPFKPIGNIQMPGMANTPLGQPVASGVPGAAKAPNLQGSRPHGQQTQMQNQANRLQPGIGWQLGINLAAQHATSSTIQQDLLNRSRVTQFQAQPQIRTAADHALTRMTDILRRLNTPPVPRSIKLALGL